jgi:hypothetical protein
MDLHKPRNLLGPLFVENSFLDYFGFVFLWKHRLATI